MHKRLVLKVLQSVTRSLTHLFTHSLCCVAVQIRSLLQSTHQVKFQFSCACESGALPWQAKSVQN